MLDGTCDGCGTPCDDPDYPCCAGCATIPDRNTTTITSITTTMDDEERPFIEVESCEWWGLVRNRVGNSNTGL